MNKLVATLIAATFSAGVFAQAAAPAAAPAAPVAPAATAAPAAPAAAKPAGPDAAAICYVPGRIATAVATLTPLSKARRAATWLAPIMKAMSSSVANAPTKPKGPLTT